MFKNKRFRFVLFTLLYFIVGAGIGITIILRPYFVAPERSNVLTVDDQPGLYSVEVGPAATAFTTSNGPPELVVMDFSNPISLDPVPEGWRHRRFLTRAPMDISFSRKNSRRAIRLATDNSASMLFRHVEVDLDRYPLLAWEWLVE